MSRAVAQGSLLSMFIIKFICCTFSSRFEDIGGREVGSNSRSRPDEEEQFEIKRLGFPCPVNAFMSKRN